MVEMCGLVMVVCDVMVVIVVDACVVSNRWLRCVR